MVIVLVSKLTYAQEKKIDLNLLFNDWAISYNESQDSVLIMRDINDKKFLSDEDRKITYPFKQGSDSTICEINLHNQQRTLYCPVGEIKSPLDFKKDSENNEIWVFDSKKMLLRHSICLGISKPINQTPCLYEALYKIEDIQEGYLKLCLKEELVMGL
jgi:hypothetical protein